MKRAILFLLVALAHSVMAAERKPNVLYILADDLGYGELSCYGGKDIPTPNIDSLATNGVRFTSGYVSCPVCSPTRAGFLTGRYQERFGHEFNPGPAPTASEVFGLSLEEKTIADRLKAMGYATGWIGKSHLGYEPQFHPQKRGFDEFFGFLGGAHAYFPARGGGKNAILRGTTPVDEKEYLTRALSREAVSFIDHHKGEPFFLYLAFNGVHAPLQAPKALEERFAKITDPKRRTFAAMLAAVDEAVGAVLAKLRENDLEKDTLIVFFSDNGGPTQQTTSSNTPLRGFKGQTLEGGIRIPFIMQWKGKIPAGKTSDAPVIALDLHPTAAAVAGGEIDPAWKLDGVNLLPFATGEKTTSPHDRLYWRFGAQAAIREGDWKLVRHGGKRPGAGTSAWELYNLSTDIGETTDLAAKEPDRAKSLLASWNEWNAQLAEPKWKRGEAGAKKKAADTPAKRRAKRGHAK